MTDINVSVGLDTSDALKDSKKYIKSLNDVIDISERLGEQTKSLNKTLSSQSRILKNSATKFADYATSLNKADSGLNRVAGRMTKVTGQLRAISAATTKAADMNSKLGAKADKLSNQLDNQNKALRKNVDSWGAVKRVVALVVFGTVAREIFTTIKAFDGLNAAMGIASGGASNAAKNMEFLRGLSNRLGTDLLSSAQNFTKFSAAAKESSLSTKEVQTVFEAVQSSGRALNLSVDDMNGTMRALTQIMSKGKVQAEELRGQLGERLPGAFQVAAKAMKVTTAELNKMLELGLVTSDEFLLAFAGQLPKSFKITEEAMHSLAAEQARLGNGFDNLILTLGKSGLNDTLKSIFAALAEFAANDEVVKFTKSLGAVLSDLGKSFVSFLGVLKTSIGTLNSVGERFPIIGSAISTLVGNLDKLVIAFIALKALELVVFLTNFSNTLLTKTIPALMAAEKVTLGWGVALKGLAALAAGFALGTVIADNFEEARIAGSFLVESLLIAFERLKVGGDILWTGFKNSATSAFEAIQVFVIVSLGAIASQYADVLSGINFGGVLDESVASAKLFATSFEQSANDVRKGSAKASDAISKMNKKLTDLAKKEKMIAKEMQEVRKGLKDKVKNSNKATTAAKKLAEANEELAASEEKNGEALRAQAQLNLLLEKYAKILDPVGVAQAKYNEQLKDLNTLKPHVSLEKYENALQAINDELEKAKKNDPDKIFATDTNKLIKGIDKVGDAWLKVGDNMEGAFGDVIDQLSAMQIQSKSFADEQVKLATRREEINNRVGLSEVDRASQLQEVTRAQGALEDKNTQAKLGGLSQIASAAASNFEEGSKAAKALTIVSQGLAVAQAVVAVATQGSGDPYTAFARIAAMIATMKSLGLSVGGGGGGGSDPTQSRQETQGTGSVLGDATAKSDSIVNALERLEEVDMDQFIELRGIFNEMVSLNNNIAQFSAGVVRAFGDFTGQMGEGIGTVGSSTSGRVQNADFGTKINTATFGENFGSDFTNSLTEALFGKVKTSIVDSGIKFFSQSLGEIISGGINAVAFADIKVKKSSLFGLSSSTSTDTETEALANESTDLLTQIFVGMGETITSALDVLGIDAVNSLESFIVDIGEISLEGLSGDEIQAELEAVFSQQGDLMAQHVLPSLVEFQKIGEGLFDTLLRVAQETAVFEQGLKLIGVGLSQFSEVGGNEFLEMSQAAIEAAGGIEAYQEAVIKFSNEVLDGSTKLALAASNAQRLSEVELADIGLDLSDTGNLDAFREAFEQIKDTLSPEEIVEWVQAGNALSDLDKAMAQFEDTLSDMLKPFSDLQDEISDIIGGLELDTRTVEDVSNELASAFAAVENLLGRGKIQPQAKAFTEMFEEIINGGFESGGIVTPTLPTEAGGTPPTKPETVITASIEDQLAALNRLKEAILANFDFQMDLIEEEREGIQNLIDAATEFQAGVQSFLEGVGQDITILEELAPDFNEAATRAAQVQSLQDELANSIELTREDELGLLEKLQSAILSNFKAQQDAIKKDFAERRKLLSDEMKLRREAVKADFSARKAAANSTISDLRDRQGVRASQENQLAELQGRLSQARVSQAQAASDAAATAQETQAQSAFDSAQALFETWNSAAEELSGFLSELDLSDLSPATNEERLGIAQERFEELLGKAQGGDAEAALGLASASQDFLTEARAFFASGQGFSDIFDRVKEQTTGVRDLAAAVQQPAPLQIGDQAIVNGVAQATNEIAQTKGEIAALKAIMEPLSTDSISAQIAAQEALLQMIANQEAEALATLAEEEAIQLAELSAQEALALETLRLETISQLQLLETRATELNALVADELLSYQEDLVALEVRADELRQQTIDLLTQLNSSVVELEAEREASIRADFDARTAANSDNADRIIGAITDNGATDPTEGFPDEFPGGNFPGDDDPFGGGGFENPTKAGIQEMNDTLKSIEDIFKGSGGGAVIQNPDNSADFV